MSLVSDVIAQARLELSDKASARWSDADMILWIRKAISRITPILYRNSIQFSRSASTITTIAGQGSYAMPSDFGTPYGLFRESNHTKLTQCNEDTWETLVSAGEATNWAILYDGAAQKVFVKGIPTGVYSLTLYYYPLIDTSAYTTASTMPWGGRLDQMIGDYVRVCCLNADEQSIATDVQMMTDIENNILNFYGGQSPLIIRRAGWNPTSGDVRGYY
jgi:hypothetical protein